MDCPRALIGLAALVVLGCTGGPATLLPSLELAANVPGPTGVPVRIPNPIAPSPPFADRLPEAPEFPAPPATDGTLTLTDCLVLAEYRNRTLIAARQRVSEADAEVEVARALGRPTLSAGFRFTAIDKVPEARLPALGVTFPVADDDVFTATLDVRYPFYTFGRLERQRQIAAIERADTIAGVFETRQRVRQEVADAYFKARLAGELLRVETLSEVLLTQQAEDVTSQFESELVPQYEQRLASAKVQLARQRVMEARIAERQAHLRLAWLIGVDAQGALLDLGEAEVEPLGIDWASQKKTLIQYALDHRPELARRRLAVWLSEARAAAVAAERLPRVDLDYRFEWTNDEFAAQQTLHRGAIIVSWPFFTGGAIEARYTRYRAERQRRLTEYAAEAEAIGHELRQAELQLREVRASLDPLAQAIEAAGENLDALRQRQTEQLATTAEVIAAETLLSDARRRRAIAGIQLMASACRLRLALGRGAFLDVTATLTGPARPELAALDAEPR